MHRAKTEETLCFYPMAGRLRRRAVQTKTYRLYRGPACRAALTGCYQCSIQPFARSTARFHP